MSAGPFAYAQVRLSDKRVGQRSPATFFQSHWADRRKIADLGHPISPKCRNAHMGRWLRPDFATDRQRFTAEQNSGRSSQSERPFKDGASTHKTLTISLFRRPADVITLGVD